MNPLTKEEVIEKINQIAYNNEKYICFIIGDKVDDKIIFYASIYSTTSFDTLKQREYYYTMANNVYAVRGGSILEQLNDEIRLFVNTSYKKYGITIMEADKGPTNPPKKTDISPMLKLITGKYSNVKDLKCIDEINSDDTRNAIAWYLKKKINELKDVSEFDIIHTRIITLCAIYNTNKDEIYSAIEECVSNKNILMEYFAQH